MSAFWNVWVWVLTLGTAMFVPFMIPTLVRFDWSGVSPWAWVAILASAVFALNVAYLIWYVAVQRRGPAQVSVWSNVVPMVGMFFAWLLAGVALLVLLEGRAQRLDLDTGDRQLLGE